jgi:hypothetical protein
MLCCVALVRTDVSEEHSTLMMKAICSSESNIPEDGILHSHHSENRKTYKFNTHWRMVSSGMLRRVALVRTTRRNIPEDAILHSHRRENLKSFNNALNSNEL